MEKWSKPFFVTKISKTDHVEQEFAQLETMVKDLCLDKTLKKLKLMLKALFSKERQNIKDSHYQLPVKQEPLKSLRTDATPKKWASHHLSGIFPPDNQSTQPLFWLKIHAAGISTVTIVAAPALKEITDTIYARDIECIFAMAKAHLDEDGAFPVIRCRQSVGSFIMLW